MSSCYIVRRGIGSSRRYHVRCRLGGREARPMHLGSFRTEREARDRQKWALGELAAMRIPDPKALEWEREEAARTVLDYAQGWLESRVDLKPNSIRLYTGALKRLAADELGRAPASTLRWQEVAAWVTRLGVDLKPATIRAHRKFMVQVLDYADLDPNPMRDRRIRLPKADPTEIDPPSRAQVLGIVGALKTPLWQLVAVTLNTTAMRVGELETLRWKDMDFAARSWCIAEVNGKTETAKRWITPPAEVWERILAETPEDKRDPLRTVLSFRSRSFQRAMAVACVAVDAPHYTPHDFRHRWISVKVREGMDIALVMRHVGHANKSETLDTYTHVVLNEDAEAERNAAVPGWCRELCV